VDGCSHHKQKKQDLQVSKKEGLARQGGTNEAKIGARGGLTKERTSLLRRCMRTFISIRYLRITVLCV
jgi:hypothetical protein